MGHHLRFSMGEILIIITAMGLLIGANVRSYDVSHPSGPPMEGRGFPITWAVDDAPLGASGDLIGDHNRDRFVFNGVLCVALSIVPVFVTRRFRGWIRDAMAPQSNPGKPLLYFCGACCLFVAVLNCFVAKGAIQIGTCLGIGLFAAIALWLAWSPFNQSNRIATILWAMSAIAILLVACLIVDPVSRPLSSRNLPGLVIVGTALLSALTLAGMAFKKPPITAKIKVNSGEFAQI